MLHLFNKKILSVGALCAIILISQSFITKKGNYWENLKVLPKDISDEELDKVMNGFNKSLGVKCKFCHVEIQDIAITDDPKLDFASDEKPAKDAAREMLKMTADINSKYMPAIGSGYGKRQVACVTCHMGHAIPLMNLDSLGITK